MTQVRGSEVFRRECVERLDCIDKALDLMDDQLRFLLERERFRKELKRVRDEFPGEVGARRYSSFFCFTILK